MKKRQAELLAPAGSYDSLRAAINAGADAVYIGGSEFGARAFADNLDSDKMKEAIDYVHLHGKKLYLTVNTLLKNNEIKYRLYEYLNPLYEHGLDAVIVQDFGVFQYIHHSFPELDIHASTQMTITGVYGADIMKQAGATRIVTARELNLAEIEEIHNHVDIEIESFIHGALCYCYSGQCLLSSMLGGRSGNRGRCAQPCRLPYEVSGSGLKNSQNEKYLLSPKDMCTIKILPQILEAGVYSLKIEGRMKSPEYVAGVTEIYRKYIDLYMKKGKDSYFVDDNDYKMLTDLYSRNGFTDGYYKCHNGRHMISLSKPSYNSVDSDRINELHTKYVAKDKKLPIHLKASISANQPMELQIKYGNNKISQFGMKPELSENHPATKDMVKKQLTKLGATPFEVEEIDIQLKDGLFLPVKGLNELRRNAVHSLIQTMIQPYKREPGSISYTTTLTKEEHRNIGQKNHPDIICSVETLEQLDSVLKYEAIKEIYICSDFIEADALKCAVEKCHAHDKRCFLTLPYIFRAKAAEFFKSDFHADGFLVKNIDELGYFKNSDTELIADYSLYTMNDTAQEFLREHQISLITAPLELNEKELEKRDNTKNQIIVYGYLPLMVTAGCVKKTLNACDKTPSVYQLKDRYQKNFRIRNSCRYCYNILYNSQPLSLLKYIPQLTNMGFSAIRLNFTFESGNETRMIIDKFLTDSSEEIEQCTHGHFKRKVD